MNELANLTEDLNVAIESMRQGIGSDPRIGYSFLYAGTGNGGPCFPKDVKALFHTGSVNGHSLKILNRFGHDLSGRTFAIWGLAFKPETDDMRDAPSRDLIAGLIRHGAFIKAFDPVAIDTAQEALQDDLADSPELWQHIEFAHDPYEAYQGADALVLVTEWKAFRSPDFAWLHASLAAPLIFDGRNLYEPTQMHALGFTYQGISRQVMSATTQAPQRAPTVATP